MPLNATALSVCQDAIALARLQRDGQAFAVMAWQTPLPADPSTIFAEADGRGRALLEHPKTNQANTCL